MKIVLIKIINLIDRAIYSTDRFIDRLIGEMKMRKDGLLTACARYMNALDNKVKRWNDKINNQCKKCFRTTWGYIAGVDQENAYIDHAYNGWSCMTWDSQTKRTLAYYKRFGSYQATFEITFEDTREKPLWFLRDGLWQNNEFHIILQALANKVPWNLKDVKHDLMLQNLRGCLFEISYKVESRNKYMLKRKER